MRGSNNFNKTNMILKQFIFIFFILLFTGCTNQTSWEVENIASEDTLIKKDTVANSEISSTSEITCPKCGHKKTETLPTEVCLLKYTCEKCDTSFRPKSGDCCVFCSYGTHKCPSMQ